MERYFTNYATSPWLSMICPWLSLVCPWLSLVSSWTGIYILQTVEFFSSAAILCVAAAFIDVTLVKTDERPPAAHNVILRAVKPLLKKNLNLNSHHHPLLYQGIRKLIDWSRKLSNPFPEIFLKGHARYWLHIGATILKKSRAQIKIC
jgi:hypothetical protein